MEDFETLVIPVDTIAPIIQKVCLLSVSINVRFVCEDLLKKQRNAFLGLEMITWRKSEWMKIGNDRTRDERYWEENTVSIIFFEIAEKGRSIHSIGPLCEPSIFFVGFNQTSRRRVGFSSWIKWKSCFFFFGGGGLQFFINSHQEPQLHKMPRVWDTKKAFFFQSKSQISTARWWRSFVWSFTTGCWRACAASSTVIAPRSVDSSEPVSRTHNLLLDRFVAHHFRFLENYKKNWKQQK